MSSIEVEIARVEDDWAVRGYSCDMWTDPPGRVWKDFEHDRDEIILVLEGELELEVGADVIRPAIGEEVVIPAGTKHTVRNLGSTVARWLYGYRRPEPD